jgi:Ca2+-binding RTX toxin-like protein
MLLCLPAAGWAAASQTPPSCTAGPTTIGDTTYGTPCGDVIVASPQVEAVQGGGGDDTILAAPVAAAFPYLGVGSQTFEGGPGDDVVYGQRGNDTLRGGAGNDQLFAGIGDDLLRGGPGNDLLAGGFGADSIDGEGGDDYVHGDGTIDRIGDTGGGTDTLSYATGITPGFGGDAVEEAGYEDLLPGAAERGVFLDLGTPPDTLNGNNGVPPDGGGFDKVEGQGFETVIGSPFADYIVGTGRTETIFGGGGGDVILGKGGGDVLDGGAGEDHVDGSGTASLRTSSNISAGLMTPGEGAYSQLYLVASNGDDAVTATYAPGPPASVTFTLEGSSAGSFDPAVEAEGGCNPPTSTQLVCVLETPLDSIVLAGMNQDDSLNAAGLPSSTTVVVLGGEGGDALTGGIESEDVLADGRGAGADVLAALGGDDALLHNDGADQLLAGDGNDLFLSVSVCDGQLLKGEADRDNASWARFKGEVGANLGSGQAGEPGSGGNPACAAGNLDSLQEVEDLEGSEFADAFYGDAGPNQLLGHFGPDIYSAAAGADTILANSGDADPFIDCGEDIDRALIDQPQYGDATPINCEAVIAADPNSFQILPGFPLPIPPPPVTLPRPVRDRTPPRTKILSRPRAVLTTAKLRRRVVFRFASSERGSTFRCKLDRKPYRPCTSPRAYALRRGRHAIRIVAVDPSGNADRTPALLRVWVRRR